MRQFYQVFPIRDTLCLELSWSHYRLLMRISDVAESTSSKWNYEQYWHLRLTPTELAARRKQYEYSRDKLLTFKKAA